MHPPGLVVYTIPIPQLLVLLPPLLLVLHPHPCPLPFWLQVLSSERLEQGGVYLAENGFDALLHLHRGVDPGLVQQLLGVSSYEQLLRQTQPLVLLQNESPASKALQDILSKVSSGGKGEGSGEEWARAGEGAEGEGTTKRGRGDGRGKEKGNTAQGTQEAR